MVFDSFLYMFDKNFIYTLQEIRESWLKYRNLFYSVEVNLVKGIRHIFNLKKLMIFSSLCEFNLK